MEPADRFSARTVRCQRLRTLDRAAGALALSMTVALSWPPPSRADPAQSAAAPPTFRTKATAVRVDVLVQRRGHAVGGLTREHFRLWDDGVEQTVDVLVTEAIPINLVLVYDTSGSVRGDTQNRLRSATERVVARLRPVDRGALVMFSDHVQVPVGLTASHELLAQPLGTIQSGGRTRLRDAVFAGLTLAAAGGEARPLVLVLSDGRDTGSWLDPVDLLELCDRTDATIYVVVMGHDESAETAEGKLLVEAARRTGGRALVARSPEDVGEAFERVLREFNGRYVLSFSPRAPTPGWHALRVSVVGSSRHAITARRGYWVER